jgi:hypothetical protein
MNMNGKQILIGVIAVVGIILGLIINPFSWNDAGNRTVVERVDGDQIVQFQPGVFYAGFFAKETEWPNQISVTYQEGTAPTDLEIRDNGIEIGQVKIRFNDATTADVKGITQFILDRKSVV